jgi:U3 small nucleolar RNA-associated protein 18
LPTSSVYTNSPTDKTPLGRVASVSVSPDGMYMAVGNEQGKIKLWEIRE